MTEVGLVATNAMLLLIAAARAPAKFTLALRTWLPVMACTVRIVQRTISAKVTQRQVPFKVCHRPYAVCVSLPSVKSALEGQRDSLAIPTSHLSRRTPPCPSRSCKPWRTWQNDKRASHVFTRTRGWRRNTYFSEHRRINFKLE